MTKKASFDHEMLSSEETTIVCFNKTKYTKEKALELGKAELLEVIDEKPDFTVREGYVMHQCLYYEGEKTTAWVQDDDFVKSRGKLSVWIVE